MPPAQRLILLSVTLAALQTSCGDPSVEQRQAARAPDASAAPTPSTPPASPPPAIATVAPASAAPAVPPAARETIGGGTLDQPAIGPAPSFGIGGVDGGAFVLVKNWNFGTDATSTIATTDQLSEHFQYHDQFGTIGNGTNYGAVMVAPTEALALGHLNQPIEGRDTGGKPIRAFTDASMKTFLVPLRGATECLPTRHDVGCGSFQAIWKLPKGGSRLGQDILWETRVRYVTPPYFWFAIWVAGNKWDRGAEIDVVESFGYDNGGGNTNYDGRFWHVGIVGGREDDHYGNWQQSMATKGVGTFDATAYHTWTMLYKADDTIAVYMDGILAQTGSSPWTLKTAEDGEALDMDFLFDAGWGHTGIGSVNKPLPASAFEGTFYEWDYSRVYLRPAAPADPPTSATAP